MEQNIAPTRDRSKKYDNKHGYEIRPRYIRTNLQNGKTLVAWMKIGGEISYIVKKEKHTIVITKQTENKENERYSVEREIKSYSDRKGYFEIWKILDNCKGYTIS